MASKTKLSEKCSSKWSFLEAQIFFYGLVRCGQRTRNISKTLTSLRASALNAHALSRPLSKSCVFATHHANDSETLSVDGKGLKTEEKCCVFKRKRIRVERALEAWLSSKDENVGNFHTNISEV